MFWGGGGGGGGCSGVFDLYIGTAGPGLCTYNTGGIAGFGGAGATGGTGISGYGCSK